jgi:tetratricopeptide (TPR) repeat protein
LEEPKSPRSLDPAIPRDLESVVLKALAKSPSDRYTTAREMADDLRRFVEDRPVAARWPGLLHRAQRWGRRHRPIVIACLAIWGVILVALAVSLVSIWRAKGETETALEQTRMEREAAREQRRVARRAVDKMYIEVASKWLELKQRMTPVQREFLTEALRFYKELSEQGSTDPEALQDAASAFARMASIQSKLGEQVQAEESYRKAVALLNGLATEFPASPEYRSELCRTYYSLAGVLWGTNRVPEAEQTYGEALALSKQLVDELPHVQEYKRSLCHDYTALGMLYTESGRLKQGLENLQEAIRLGEQLVQESPERFELRILHGSTYYNLAVNMARSGKGAEIRPVVERGITEELAAIRINQNAREAPKFLTACYLILAEVVFAPAGQQEEAVRYIGKAIDVAKDWVAKFPDEEMYRQICADAYTTLAPLLRDSGRLKEADQAHRDAIAVYAEAVAMYPRVAEYRGTLAHFYHELTLHMLLTQRPHEALKPAKQALDLEPENELFWYMQGAAQYRTGEYKEAVVSLGNAEKHNPRGDPRHWLFLAMSHARLGNVDEARRWYDKAGSWMDKNKTNDERLQGFRAEAEELLGIKHQGEPELVPPPTKVH